MKYQILLSISWFIITLSTHAQITTDGTLGSQLNLLGPNYQINADLGQQQGGNLFHSFQEFNLQGLESATFSGPNSVNNIISRVTGGNPSHIDGTLRSTIPNADMYFLNPSGIILGPNAKLDVSGSFHASTADYLRLQDGGRFDANQPANTLLTVTPVEAFGFLTNSPASLSIEGSELSILANETFSLIGSHLTIKGAQITVPSGRINLASIAQAGEVKTSSMEAQAFEKQGILTISEHTNINVNGVGAGEIFIRGGQLLMHDSTIQANTLGNQDGKGIDMKLTESINITGNLAAISSNTFGSARAGNIVITTPSLEMTESKIDVDSMGEGDSGNLAIKSNQIALYDGAVISGDSFGSGMGGQLNISATEKIWLTDQRLYFDIEEAKFRTSISSTSLNKGRGGRITINTGQLVLSSSGITSNTHYEGDAGEIIINADDINLIKGGLISATALSQATGIGGNIDINLTETLHLSGFRPGLTKTSTDIFTNLQSGIGSLTFGAGQAGNISIVAKNVIVDDYSSIAAATVSTGTAGHLLIEVENLYLKGGGFITNSSGGNLGGKIYLGTGASGSLKIIATSDIIASGYNNFNQSGIFSNTLLAGAGGNIEIQANNLILTDSATISANSLGTDNAGKITIQANTIRLTNNGKITTSAEQASGGNITLMTPNLLYLQAGEITTSVSNQGDGGNIIISNPKFIILDKGQMTAQANEGRGGNIRMTSNQFIKSPDSIVNTSSKLGIDGNLEISAPELNLDEFIVVLPGEFMEKTILKRCDIEEIENPSTFKITPKPKNLPFIR